MSFTYTMAENITKMPEIFVLVLKNRRNLWLVLQINCVWLLFLNKRHTDLQTNATIKRLY